MAFVATNKDGTEIISNSVPFYAEKELNRLVVENEKYEMYRYLVIGMWANDFSNGYFNVPKFNGVVLPKGTIKKLTGRDLTFDDDPVELT